MRRTCLNMIHALAQRDPRVVFIGSDLSPGLLDDMKQEMPLRHYMEGVTEANVIAMAAGMAMDGYLPYVNTIATFITRRCYEQVALDLCLHDLPVRLIGNGGGLVYAPLGPTHLAVEDIAIMRALPNMAVVCVCDAAEMTRLMEVSLDWPHPLYIRLAKGGDAIVSDQQHGFSIGQAIILKPCEAPERVLLVSTGVMTTRTLEAATALESQGIPVEVLHMHTIKPLDDSTLVRRAIGTRAIFTVEEHTVIGGLGSAVVDCLVERLPGKVPPLRKLGLPDRFVTNYGSQDDLLRIAGLQPPQLVDSIMTELQGSAAA